MALGSWKHRSGGGSCRGAWNPPLNVRLVVEMLWLRDLLFADLDQAQRTAIWRVGITALLVFHVSWACGWVPGLPGFAMATDYQVLSVKVNRVERSLLEKDLVEAQERFCNARAGGNITAQRYAEERRRRLSGEFRAVSVAPMSLPSCTELGIK